MNTLKLDFINARSYIIGLMHSRAVATFRCETYD